MGSRLLRDTTDSEKVNTLSWQAEVFFYRLMMKADDHGCYHANPKLVRASLFPLRLDSIREADISRWLQECEQSSLIVIYEVDSKPYLQIDNFGQRLRTKKMRFPHPVENPPTNDRSPPPEEKGREDEVEERILIRIGNEKFQKKCSEIFKNEYRSLFESTMMNALKGMDGELILIEMDKKYSMYDFRDRNHFGRALQKVGNELRGKKYDTKGSNGAGGPFGAL